MLVGVISDTHGLLRPEALAALEGATLILHAGDIGSPGVLEQLGRLAPVTAVRGNNDRDAWARAIPDTRTVEAGGARIYIIHDVNELDVEPAEYSAVIAGHSHRPGFSLEGGVLYFNPGSAGPRRFSLPVSVGLLSIEAGRLEPRIVELTV